MNWKQMMMVGMALVAFPFVGQAQVDEQMDGMRHERSDGYVWPKDSQVLQKLEQWQDSVSSFIGGCTVFPAS